MLVKTSQYNLQNVQFVHPSKNFMQYAITDDISTRNLYTKDILYIISTTQKDTIDLYIIFIYYDIYTNTI